MLLTSAYFSCTVVGMRKYYCKHCGKTALRKSDKAWIKSWCEVAGKYVHIIRKEKKK